MNNTTYPIYVRCIGGRIKRHQANSKKLQRAGNVNKYIFNIYPRDRVKQIRVRCYNSNTGKRYTEITYDRELESYKNQDARLIVKYKWGEQERMYLERSTGWIPIYLVIKRRDSIGGGGLLATSIKSVRRVY